MSKIASLLVSIRERLKRSPVESTVILIKCRSATGSDEQKQVVAEMLI